MYIEDIKNNYYIVKLNEKHDLNDFSCGLDDMDDFLKMMHWTSKRIT
ncbi:hypothetical protein [uncultured Methanobrevibacter sp.]|nr:hypothetical protein [uncultured Methanobrevibacter sp.]